MKRGLDELDCSPAPELIGCPRWRSKNTPELSLGYQRDEYGKKANIISASGISKQATIAELSDAINQTIRMTRMALRRFHPSCSTACLFLAFARLSHRCLARLCGRF